MVNIENEHGDQDLSTEETSGSEEKPKLATELAKRLRKWRIPIWLQISLVVVAVAVIFWFFFMQPSPGDVLGIVPDGEYWRISGKRPFDMYNSNMYRWYMNENAWARWELEKIKERAEALEIEFNQIRYDISFESNKDEEDLKFTYGFSKEADLVDYLERELEVEFEKELEHGRTYWSVGSDVRGSRQMRPGWGFMVISGGLLEGNTVGLEAVIGAVSQGERKLADNKSLAEARGLVDLSASEFSLQWAEIESAQNKYKKLVDEITDDKEVFEALEEIEAIGISQYWRDDYEIVFKIRFSSESAAKKIMDFLDTDVQQLFSVHGEEKLKQRFPNRRLENLDRLEELGEKAAFSVSGKVLEIRFKADWGDFEMYLGKKIKK